MKHEIIYLNIKRNATPLFENNTFGSIQRVDKSGAVEVWENSSEEFKNNVLKEIDKEFEIHVTAFLIAKLKEVTIFSSNLSTKSGLGRYRDLYLVSNKNIKKMEKVTAGRQTKITAFEKNLKSPKSPVVIEWLDAFTDKSLKTAEEIMDKKYVEPLLFAGNFIGTSNNALYIATIYNATYDKYRNNIAIPIKDVVSLKKLNTIKK